MSWEDPNQYSSWDKLTLGTEKFPGVARASGECMRALELQKSNASDGAPIEDSGYKNVSIDITVRYLSEDHKKMRGIVDALHPRTQGKDRAPLAVTLEQINFVGVSQVYLRSIGIPQISNGIGSITIKVLEFVKDKPKPRRRPTVTAVPLFTQALLFEPFAPTGIAAIEAGFASSEAFL